MNRVIRIHALLFLFLCRLDLTAQAQPEFHYGPRIGIGLSSFVGRDAAATNFPAGTIVGLYTQTRFSNKVALDVELNYISLGSLFSVNRYTPEQRDFKVALGYISMPVSFNYRLYKQIHVQAGVQLSTLLTGYSEMKYHNQLTKDKTIAPYHSTDVGPTIGCYYQFEKGLQIGVRYYRGVQNIFKENYQIYNSNIQFLLTYQFSRAAKEL